MNETARTDQQAAASREAARKQHAATLNGEPVTIRTITANVTPGEAEALARGEVPPAVQSQIDRQFADDATIEAIEHDWRAGGEDPAT